ncbi:MAG: HlyD family efflux transporter periplasmic adaptor subunit [Oscillospiraceae bacterium]|nr:HlyD family efflux transporter periplasmic adaptor subunit [Oscillospiraceae bacterium]
MDEMKVKKRGWIKNAVIVFLSIMLILTFFSNTFMNRSLSEVSTKLVISGEITAQVRGGGVVTANETYNVTLPQTREVESVKVKAGDEVNEGDVLFTLSGNVSDELRAAEKAVHSANVAYQKALIEASETDYARDNRDIQDAREDLSAAQNLLNYYGAGGISVIDAKAAVDKAKVAETDAKKLVDQYTKELADLKEEDVDNDKYWDAYNALSDAQSVFSGSVKSYKGAWTKIAEDIIKYQLEEAKHTGVDKLAEACAELAFAEFAGTSTSTAQDTIASITKDNTAMTAAYNTYNQSIKSSLSTYMTQAANNAYSGVTVSPEDALGYTNLVSAKREVERAQEKLDATEMTVGGSNSTARKNLQDKLKKAQEDYDKAVTAREKAETVQTAAEEARTKERALEDKIFELEQKQKEDNKNAQLAQLNLEELRYAISEAQQNLAELQKDATEPEVKAKVSGIIGEINVTAGKQAEAGQTLCTITVPDMGYNVSFSASSEQARRVRVGDTATIANNWRGGISATVSNIKTDPKNPQTSKIITFDITGDVEPGTSLNLTVGSRGEQYETIVPNSALRSDSNGDFVLVVTSRSSPLGNRYIATRVNVEKKASDDTNTAVTGELSANDYVITTSSKPIKDKDMVRLAGE